VMFGGGVAPFALEADDGEHLWDLASEFVR